MKPGATFKLALAQMFVSPGEREVNLRRAIEFISRAAEAKADLILLPEALPYGWTDPSGKELAREIPEGDDYRELQAAAKRNRIYVCSGLVERTGNRLFNSGVLISPTGELLLHHRKINELAFAHEIYALGESVTVCDTPLGRMGIMICADAFIPGQVISRTLGQMGAQIILSPCAWAVPPHHDNSGTPYGQLWVDNYQPVCREFGLWIGGCSNVGVVAAGAWKGYRCIGNSLLMGPTGEIACCGSHGSSAEELMLQSVTLQAPKRPTGAIP